MIDAALSLLISAQNVDGGWGYFKGKRSNTESTSFVVMALDSLDRRGLYPVIGKGLKWLLQHQNKDGSWCLNDASPSWSWTTPLAVLALLPFPEQRMHALRAAQWLLTQEGRKPGWVTSVLIRVSVIESMTELDPYLSGWSWTPDTFSWVEPTSYALMAIKKLSLSLEEAKVKERIQQAEMLVYDRMCKNGGWNYGNATVLGEGLWPYADVTAIALIALQDRRVNKANKLSLRALDALLRETSSGMALGWGIICMETYGEDVRHLKSNMVQNFQKTAFLGEVKTLALSLLALSSGTKLFRI